MNEIQLNLARKWRSKQFEQIVGQDLSVRILKNSLFLGKFFPVYLFAGQHGCGKTTTARVFAAAVNCERLPDFQQNPKKFIVPCLECNSCKAMMQGNHPDFIEMDAASHTGVDNVRQIIEASSLLPLLGGKKVYLIDEAHMLSKAAFNAFLKILEEPPASVFFILATTDDHKIIDTVRSRCFQLFFNAVDQNALLNHLVQICEQEGIKYEPEGLALIIKETRGSVRDALNLMEQVGFSAKQVGRKEVLSVLGYLPEELFIKLFSHLVVGSSLSELIQFIQDIKLSEYSVDYMWRRLLQVIRAAVWLKAGVKPDDFSENQDLLRQAVASVSLSTLIQLFEFFCSQEQQFFRTIHKSTFLQLFLVRAWQSFRDEYETGVNVPQSQEIKPFVSKEKNFESDVKQEDFSPVDDKQKEVLEQRHKITIKKESQWDQFLSKVDELQEPLLTSVFKQAQFEKVEENLVTVLFAQRLRLFHDTLEQMKDKWLPLLQIVFGNQVQLDLHFNLIDKPSTEVKKKIESVQQVESVNYHSSTVKKNMMNRGFKIDVSDKERWPLTNQLLDYFPGTVVELPKAKQEQGNE